MAWIRGLFLALVLGPPPASAAAIVGDCRFNVAQLAFEGRPSEQATCLLRNVRIGGALGPRLDTLPPTLAGHVGQAVAVQRDAVRRHLRTRHLNEAQLGGSLDAPLSTAHGGAPGAPMARYFVIHNTSAPYFASAPFPIGLDRDRQVNRLDRYQDLTNGAVAHVFVNRGGAMLVGHDFAVPWRATKLESEVVGMPAKGLFVHIELVQPRRRDPSSTKPRNDRLAPEPGFSTEQYDRLALLYMVSSVRAGLWLVPAFHAAIDAGLRDGHDDPQNFCLNAFDQALGRVLAALRSQ